MISSFDKFSLVLGSPIRSYVIIYQYRILVFDCFDYEDVNFQIVYIFTYICNSKIDSFNWVIQCLFKFLICYLIHIIDSCQWELDFSQVLFEWCSFGGFKTRFQHSIRRFWSWKMNISERFFIASRYVFQASGCFFQHLDIPYYISFMFCDFSKNICFFSIDSLYSISNRYLELLILNSKHYIKIEVVLFRVFVSIHRCSWPSSCRHPDTVRGIQILSYSIRIASKCIRIPL